MPPSLPDLQMLNEQFGTNIIAHLGITYTAIGQGFLEGEMPVDERTRQPLGQLHGGASVVLAESLGSLAANVHVDWEKQFCVGLDVSANHIKAVRAGKVFGRAEAEHLGKRTQVWSIRINNEAGELVCLSRLTMAVLDRD